MMNDCCCRAEKLIGRFNQMNTFDIRKFLMGTGVLIWTSALAFTPQALAQEGADQEVEEITVTGSRIKRDTFSTTTPIQVLNTESAQRIGITSISELLQKSTAASGEQIDAGINTNAGQTNASEAPPDGGAGSSCINLRGLGCERTLVLVNGKRLGVAGIRGAPPQPDINMLPIGMVEGVDLLTGGLSTVYGADAVAGVVNVRLKKDFEGLSLTASSELTDHEGGEIYHASLVGGVGNDLGNITFGVEYSRQERVRSGDRDFSSCTRVGNYGVGHTLDNIPIRNCSSFFPDNWVVLDRDVFADGTLVSDSGIDLTADGNGDVLFMTPGATDIGIDGFSSIVVAPDTDVYGENLAACPDDPNCFGSYLWRFIFNPAPAGGPDGQTNDTLARQNADLWRPYERFSLVLNGHLDPGWGGNSEVYFEGYYFNRSNDIIGATEQIFPTVPAMIPLLDSDGVNLLPDANGAPQMVLNPMNPFAALGTDAEVVISLDDIPQTFDTELQQIRLVTGITGDISDDGRWSYDVSASYDRATGFVAQPILLENNLVLATNRVGMKTDASGAPTGEVACGFFNQLDNGGFLSLPDCVPVDLFAPSIAGVQGVNDGHFATQAERDFLLGNRTNRTVTDTWQVQAYAFGDLFDVPGGGTVGTAFGVEYRLDQIDSQNSALGVMGLNAAENPLQEGETRGDRTTFDVYAEISAPVVVDAAWADLFQIDAAIRFTDDENFGNETVYKLGFLWDINEYFSFSSSFNTSFRAPNLREQFLADQALALPASVDPCRQPFIDNVPPGPTRDRLEANCILSGADITLLGTDFQIAIPAAIGGASSLKPETSDSFTATISASQPWTDRFDFDIALTYFDIQIEDTVRALDPGTIINRCFFDQDNLESPFCARVERDRGPATPATANFISFVRAGFVNTGDETASGFDITTRLLFDIGDSTFNWSTATTLLDERTSQEFPPSDDDPDGSAIVDDVGRIGNPEITFQSTLAWTMNSWDVVWQSRWWDDTQFSQGIPNPVYLDGGLIVGGPNDGQDPLDVYGSADNFTALNYSGTFLATGLRARPVAEAEGQWHHDLGVTYSLETVAITAGVNNITDEEPPIISWNTGPNTNGAVSSARYDLVGRTYFLRLNVEF
jgi:iron complex outermembrane receptor protein